MDYNKQKKPGILPKTAIRSKKQRMFRETEHRLPISRNSLAGSRIIRESLSCKFGVSEMDPLLKHVSDPPPISTTIHHPGFEMETLKKIIQAKWKIKSKFEDEKRSGHYYWGVENSLTFCTRITTTKDTRIWECCRVSWATISWKALPILWDSFLTRISS